MNDTGCTRMVYRKKRSDPAINKKPRPYTAATLRPRRALHSLSCQPNACASLFSAVIRNAMYGDNEPIFRGCRT
jgi:hypothetical protein